MTLAAGLSEAPQAMLRVAFGYSVRRMPAPEPADASVGSRRAPPDVAALIPMVRRIISARVPDRATADDLVQETLARVLAAAGRNEPGMLEPYAIVTARDVVA